MPRKKYSEVEELQQIKDRLIDEKRELERRLAATKFVIEGMKAEYLELSSRAARLEQHASMLGYDITK